MPQEIKQSTVELLQPKNEISQSDQNDKEKHLNSSQHRENEKDIKSQPLQIKKEIDKDFKEVGDSIKQQDQTKIEPKPISQQSEKEEGNSNNHSQPTGDTNMPEQLKENEKVVNNEPKENITNKHEKIMDKDCHVIINNNESIPIAEICNSNTEQLEVTNEANSDTQKPQENKENNQSNKNEEETKSILPQSEQEALSNQQDEPTKESNDNSEQPETEKETIDNPDQIQEDLGCNSETDLDFENNSEFEIIDIADYDPEFPTEDGNENPSEVKEKVEETTGDAAKTATGEAKTNKPENKKKLTDARRQELLQYLEKQIVENKLNPNNLPPRIWRSLKLLSGAQRKKFLRTMKERYAKTSGQTGNKSSQVQGETGPINDMIKQGVINDLSNSLSQWLLEHWETIDVNTERKTTVKKEKPLSEAQKRKFMKNTERMIDRNMLDVHNLPPRTWHVLKQLKSNERNRFLKTMKEKFGKRSSTGQSAARITDNFRVPSNTIAKRNYGKSAKLPPRSHTPANKNKGRRESGNESSYSFDRDFKNQRFNERDNIATTSKVSPNIFSHSPSFQDRFSHNRSYEDYSEPHYRSFSDGFKTPNSFSYDNKRYMEGDNQSSYPDNSNYQSQSQYPDRDMNFQFSNSGNSSRAMGKSSYDPRYAAGLSQETLSSYQDMYGNKRKFMDNMTSYNQSQPKRSNMDPNQSFNNANDDSIKSVITDDSNPKGTINEEQASLLTAELVHLLDKVSMSDRGHIPRFYNSALSRSGVFRITCADQTSFDWLKNMVSNLPPLWNGAKLHVGNFTNFSSKRVRANVFIPGGLEDSAVTLSRLERQNPGLNTGAWKVSRQTGNSRGQVLFLEIDEQSVQVLKNMDFKAFLGLSCITFQIPESYNKKPNKRR